MERLSEKHPVQPSYRKHQREFKRQILLPIIITAIIGSGITAIITYAAVIGNSSISLWADISIIWLIIPLMVTAVIVLALLIAMVKGLSSLLRITPVYTSRAQNFVLWLSAEIKMWTNKITGPVLTLNSWLSLLLKKEESNER